MKEHDTFKRENIETNEKWINRFVKMHVHYINNTLIKNMIKNFKIGQTSD